MKKIYTLEVYLNYNDNINIRLSNFNKFINEYDAIAFGKEKLKELFINYNIIDPYDNKLYYEITVLEIIENSKLDKNYDINNLNKLSKEELYDALLLISGGKKSYYDFNGNLLSIEKMNNDYYNSFSFKSLLGYHSNKFNIGDKVRFKYANNKSIGIIVGKYNTSNENIYTSNDPYHFKEGYNVEYTIDEYTTYNENWQEPYYDEDLELIKD